MRNNQDWRRNGAVGVQYRTNAFRGIHPSAGAVVVTRSKRRSRASTRVALLNQVERVLTETGRATGVTATVTPRGGGKVTNRLVHTP